MNLSKSELMVVAKALIGMEKSVERLAAKDGQPEGVVKEYLKVKVEINELMRKVNAELLAADKGKKTVPGSMGTVLGDSMSPST